MEISAKRVLHMYTHTASEQQQKANGAVGIDVHVFAKGDGIRQTKNKKNIFLFPSPSEEKNDKTKRRKKGTFSHRSRLCNTITPPLITRTFDMAAAANMSNSSTHTEKTLGKNR